MKLPLSINPRSILDGRCPMCGARATEFYEMACACCEFKEACCRACASPEALQALASVLRYRKRIDAGAGAMVERETWEE